MFAGGSGEADLVVVCRFAGIRVVEMPVEDGIRTGVGSFEDKLLPFAGEAFRKIKDGVMLRIDQFDLPAPVFAASRFDRRQGSVVDMIGGSTNHGRAIIRPTDSHELFTRKRPSAERWTSRW